MSSHSLDSIEDVNLLVGFDLLEGKVGRTIDTHS